MRGRELRERYSLIRYQLLCSPGEREKIDGGGKRERR